MFWCRRLQLQLAVVPMTKRQELDLHRRRPPTQWCGKVARLCQRTGEGWLSWGSALCSMNTSLSEMCRTKQRSTQFCFAGFSLCRTFQQFTGRSGLQRTPPGRGVRCTRVWRCLPEDRPGRSSRTGSPQNHLSGGNAWRVLMARRHACRVPSGPSSHHQMEPFLGLSVVHSCHPFHVLTSESRLEPHLRRFWCSLPLSAHSRQRGRLLDDRGHDQVAGGRAGVLGRRGFPIESRGSPGLSGGRRRVSVNVCVADLELISPGVIDDRKKIEVMGGGFYRSSTERNWQSM